MSGIEVRPSALRVAAQRLSSAHDTVASSGHPGEVRHVAGALPGSTSAAAAGRCAGAWADARDAWTREARRHVAALQDSATAYETSDIEAARSARAIAEEL